MLGLFFKNKSSDKCVISGNAEFKHFYHVSIATVTRKNWYNFDLQYIDHLQHTNSVNVRWHHSAIILLRYCIILFLLSIQHISDKMLPHLHFITLYNSLYFYTCITLQICFSVHMSTGLHLQNQLISFHLFMQQYTFCVKIWHPVRCYCHMHITALWGFKSVILVSFIICRTAWTIAELQALLDKTMHGDLKDRPVTSVNNKQVISMWGTNQYPLI